MRLSSIKLSGFKSFVEPTHFELPGELVGVVGPNGCGKSNIMDAVRWVLGETRASELRGDSMQDVIFSGTTTRKPAGRASVELIFDNPDQRAGGQWSQYTQIAVKRTLTRDGTSSYYINGQQVRRKDIHDVFMGTGLGPRAYAIIGQGTISKIIESRPEDIRLYLEEAAGVSKYKERRRETQNRLTDAKENLTRIQDILRELATQTQKLNKQAQIAKEHQELTQKAQTKQNQYWWLKLEQTQNTKSEIDQKIQTLQNSCNQQVKELTDTKQSLEQLQETQEKANEELQEAQANYYQTQAQVSNIQAQIAFDEQNKNNLQDGINKLKTQITHWQEQLESALAQEAELKIQLEEQAENQEILTIQLEELSEELPAIQEKHDQEEKQTQDLQTQQNQQEQQIKINQIKTQNHKDQSQEKQNKQTELKTQLQTLKNQTPNNEQLQKTKEQWQTAAQKAEEQTKQTKELQEKEQELAQEKTKNLQTTIQETEKLTKLTAKAQALKALQDKLQNNQKINTWLEQNQLEQEKPLWQEIQIQKNHEKTIEAILGEKLNAIKIPDQKTAENYQNSIPPQTQTLYKASAGAQNQKNSPEEKIQNLKNAIEIIQTEPEQEQLKNAIKQWLSGAYIAPDIKTALQEQSKLKIGETIYTPEGHSITQNSITYYNPQNEQAGKLARAAEIKELEAQITEQEKNSQAAKTKHQETEEKHKQISEQIKAAQQEAQKAQQEAQEAQIQTKLINQQAEQSQQRHEQIKNEINQLETQITELNEQLQTLQKQTEELKNAQNTTQEQAEKAKTQTKQTQNKLEQLKENIRAQERKIEQNKYTKQNTQSRLEEITRQIAQAKEQIQNSLAQQNKNQELLQTHQSTNSGEQLQNAKNQNSQAQEKLKTTRQLSEQINAQYKQTDETRLRLEMSSAKEKEQIAELKLKQQAQQIAAEQIKEQLQEADLEKIKQSLEENQEKERPTIENLQKQINQLQTKANQLGPINMAALEELKEATERQKYLTEQKQDIEQAASTLEEAIKTIDEQTKELLQNTFSTVNGHFGRIFTTLFGGGSAKLIMTGQQILDAGVQVMAQPPGKKNQSIQLLSGGEKALTAIALVFAMFELNPAPFCLLDEVDAPLDDANTERYAKLVATMSTQGTQFLFISHNKIAMEMASQLIGVTMQEKGVSRIVAVNMQKTKSQS